MDWIRLEWTFGNFVGKTWEKLGTFGIDCEGVTFLFGNFVGITWEKLGKKYAIFNPIC